MYRGRPVLHSSLLSRVRGSHEQNMEGSLRNKTTYPEKTNEEIIRTLLIQKITHTYTRKKINRNPDTL